MAQLNPSHSVPQDLIARDQAPFFWTYLDKPADGTILLTWQPLSRLGTNFATDGFVWAPPEQIYKHDLGNGLMLEIYYLKAGYIPGEQFTLHARRRFRLVPVAGHPNPPQPDPNLFIVHYGPAEMNDRVPVAMIPYDERVNAIMQQRHFLQRAGQIRRKEFMLSDRVNWPSLPELTRQQMGPQMNPRGVPQQMAYPAQPPPPGPPSKRARHGQNQGQPAALPPGMPPVDAAFDDDEDISRGDMFDHLTPREISMSRYQQNHEWMEEILSSAYRISQITPADLGLGLKGELASLTEGIFTAQGGEAYSQAPEKAYVGRLDPGQADEFRKRVDKYVTTTQAEIKKMEEEHLKTMAALKEHSLLKLKEKELRTIVDGPASAHAKHESRSQSDDESVGRQVSKHSVEEVVQQVESASGRKIVGLPLFKRIQDGGYQAPAPEPPAPGSTAELSRQPSRAGSQASGAMMGETDMDMGDTASGLLDQMHTGFSSTSTPVNNFPTPQTHLSAGQSGAGTPSQAANTASPAAAPAPAPTAPVAAPTPPPGDIEMGGTDTVTENEVRTTPDHGTGSGDWVVVPKDDDKATANDTTQTTTQPPADAATTTAAAPAAVTESAAEGEDAKPPTPAATKAPSAAATPAVTEGGSVSFDQNDFSSLGDLDTAGDALAGYDAPDLDDSAGGLDDGLDLQMDMEDSAFGDAFHGVDASHTPGDGQNQDGM
ncbi:swi snf and rsc complex subunit ssr4 [Trichoderma arundinaceum]|uniref:Swi snf and rsc complex subunit ssr4 n=1 Tax=Trichoderma arundinaceum TaxID=490622 RepID=A0A395NA33_TRIAR|nr:swi snf and rsc complex subunit ssr4 [Trichoderma arundinaceum]